MSASGGARTNAKCEDCQLTSKNYGLPDSGARWKARWCGKCAKKYGGVLRATAAKLQQDREASLGAARGGGAPSQTRTPRASAGAAGNQWREELPPKKRKLSPPAKMQK